MCNQGHANPCKCMKKADESVQGHASVSRSVQERGHSPPCSSSVLLPVGTAGTRLPLPCPSKPPGEAQFGDPPPPQQHRSCSRFAQETLALAEPSPQNHNSRAMAASIRGDGAEGPKGAANVHFEPGRSPTL